MYAMLHQFFNDTFNLTYISDCLKQMIFLKSINSVLTEKLLNIPELSTSLYREFCTYHTLYLVASLLLVTYNERSVV